MPFFAYAETYNSSWSEFEPYSYIKNNQLVGIDIDLSRKIFESIGAEVKFDKINWSKSLELIKEEDLDFLISATHTQQREKYAFFSLPYRHESLSIILLKNPRIIINFRTPQGLITSIRNKNFRIGTVNSYAYPEIVVNNFIKQTAKIKADSSQELVQAMYDNKIDGFITDTNEARAIVRNSNSRLSDLRTGMRTPIRLMLSKKKFDNEDVKKINSIIRSLLKSKFYQKIIRQYYDYSKSS